MAYRLDFHPAAEAELEEAVSWYQKQQSGLEQEFFDEYLEVERRLEENAQQFPAILENIRRATFHRFPYSIFFLVEGDMVFILAVFHQSRNPGEWEKRI